MATYNKFEPWAENMVKVANLGSDQFTLALCAAANAPVAANGVLADLVQIAYTNLSSRDLVTISAIQTGGVFALVLQDLTLSAAGGPVGPFRYVVVYDNTPAAPLDPLVGWYDYSTEITLLDGETILIDLAAAGLFTLQ